jgi:hypothetical protein
MAHPYPGVGLFCLATPHLESSTKYMKGDIFSPLLIYTNTQEIEKIHKGTQKGHPELRK